MTFARSGVWLDRASTLLMFELLGYAVSLVLFGNEDVDAAGVVHERKPDADGAPEPHP